MATERKKPSRKESVVTERLHKSSGSAVPCRDYDMELDPQGNEWWFVAILTHQKYTAPCCKYIEEELKEHKCKCYVPAKEELHVYPNRTKRMVTKYVIPRLVFVTGITEEQAYNYAYKWPYVDIFMPDRARERSHGHVALAKVSNSDLIKLRNAIKGVRSADDVAFTTENLEFDEQLEVVSGSLKGLEGGYYKDEGNDYLVFTLGKLGNIKVRVSISDCSLKKKALTQH